MAQGEGVTVGSPTPAFGRGASLPATHRGRLGKRALVFVFSVLALLFCSPLIARIQTGLRCTEVRAKFYAQQRIRRDAARIPSLKPGTMVRDADAMLERVLASSPVGRAEWNSTRKLT